MKELKQVSTSCNQLLCEILDADNPTEMLSKRFENISSKEDLELRGIIKELKELGYIDVKWADNVPYYVIVNNSARTYREQLREYESERNQNDLKLSNCSKIL